MKTSGRIDFTPMDGPISQRRFPWLGGRHNWLSEGAAGEVGAGGDLDRERLVIRSNGQDVGEPEKVAARFRDRVHLLDHGAFSAGLPKM